MVARGGISRQGSIRAVVVRAGTGHCTTVLWVGRGGDFVAVEGEVGNVVTGFGHREGVFSSGNHILTHGPVREGVPFVGRGRQGGGREVLVRTSTGYCTTVGRVGRNGDGVADRIEIGGEVAVADYRDSARILGIAVVPFDEGVSFIGRGRQGGGGTVVVSARAGHRTAALRIGGSGNDEAVDGEVGSEAAVADHRDSARVVGIAVVPVHKVVVVAGRGPQDDVGAFGVGGAAYKYIVASRARHCAAVLRIDGSVDGVSGLRGLAYIDVVNVEVTAPVRGSFNGKVMPIAGVVAEIHRVLGIDSVQRDIFSHLHEGGCISWVAYDTHMEFANKIFCAVRLFLPGIE